jgi:hypothetical protein
MDAGTPSKYEILSLLLSVVAAVISAFALFRGYRLAQRQTVLQTKQEDLAAFQHRLLLREQEQKARPDLRANFVRSNRNFRFVLLNAGSAAARDVRLTDLIGNAAPEPLIKSQCDAIFPVKELRTGESVSLVAAINFQTVLPARLIVTWDDDAGDAQQRELSVDIAAPG